ncbi:hypothetical protein MA16_Dca006022 [Dendrobium catenatum]|uniref:Uncharacterized protein n=1 Tax=Dendrobium catenatum TaxID=906689 RepID=A0A2I0WJY6_9ASPA|nr:hypothetical protein MA16_Dca006022 [Dendrobium catenatum]
MRVLKWTPFFDIKEESPIVPIWISFPNLRLHFFNSKVLHALGTIFGRPLQIDQATASRTRPSVSRVLVEVDILKKHPKEIWVGSKAYGYLQKAKFEKVPDFCTHCKIHGHANVDCFKIHPDLKKAANYESVRPGSAVNNHVEVPIVEKSEEENTVIPVEPPQTDHNSQLDVNEEICRNVREEVGNKENMDLINLKKGIQTNEDHRGQENNSSTSTNPKLFILVDDMLNELPFNSNSVAIENALLSKQVNRDEELNIGGVYSKSYEEGEFIPPSNADASLNTKQKCPASSPNLKGPKSGEEEFIHKGGKKKGTQGKNACSPTPRSTRAQTSSKYGND